MKLDWNFVFILSCFFTRAFGAISPRIQLTSALTSTAASSSCAAERFTITSPYGITGPNQNCSEDHPIDLLLDGNETTWWQSMTQAENVTLHFQFNDVSLITWANSLYIGRLLQSFVLSGARLVFRSPLPQLLLVQVRQDGALITTLAYADDCQVYNGANCYPLRSIVDYDVRNCTSLPVYLVVNYNNLMSQFQAQLEFCLWQVNCSSDISSCPRLVNLSHAIVRNLILLSLQCVILDIHSLI